MVNRFRFFQFGQRNGKLRITETPFPFEFTLNIPQVMITFLCPPKVTYSALPPQPQSQQSPSSVLISF